MKQLRVAAIAAMSFVLAASGVSVDAGQNESRVAPRRQEGPTVKSPAPVALKSIADDSVVLQVDDNSFEVAIGIVEQANPPRFGNQGVFLNRFTPDEDLLPFSVDEVAILFPTSDSAGNTGLQPGMPFDILVYTDPTGSANPANATLEARVPISLMPSNTTLQTVRLDNPIVVETGDVWIGFTNTVTALDEIPIYPAAADVDGTVQNRSYAFFNGAPRSHFNGQILANAEAGVIFSGNWLIRAQGQSGGLTAICWDGPDLSLARGGLPPPRNARNCSSIPQLPKIDAERRQSPVRGYNVYRGNAPGVQPTPENLFATTPPNQTSVNSSVAPGGSFFTITATYDEGESGPSNEFGVFPPVITKSKVKDNKVVAKGFDFTDTVIVLLDGIPFQQAAVVKKQGRRVVQKGLLITGQSAAAYVISQGGSAELLIRNSNGGLEQVDVFR